MKKNIISDFFDIPEEDQTTENIDIETSKKEIVNNLNYLKSLTVEEFQFYKKWEELNDPSYSTLGDKPSIVKSKIWTPTDLNDEDITIKEITDLRPKLVYVDNKKHLEQDWLMLRLFCHTMDFNQNPGRFLKFLIVNETDDRYLGVLSVASDVITITDRDKYIGWTNENRIKDRKLVNSAIGSCIMSTQPFGFNFFGGKLAACLTTSKVVRDTWENLYNNVLAGITTTSLYGSFSMYNGLKWWHKCGSSTGKILIKPDEKMYKKWHDIIKLTRTDEYNKKMTQKEGISGPVTGAKLRVLDMIYKEIGVKQKNYCHGFERGVYYSCFYENTKEFLMNKIKQSDLKMKPLFKDDMESIMNWWRPKAIERYKKLKSENNLKPEILYYDRISKSTYEESKARYFKEVGR